MNKQLNKKSEEFINWVKESLEEDEFFNQLIDTSIEEVRTCLTKNKELLITELLQKLFQGGLEHGDPIYSEIRVEGELHQEHLDLLGWRLIGIYNAVKEPRLSGAYNAKKS